MKLTKIGVAQYYAKTGILYVDNSILSTLATCETKAMMRYGYNLTAIDDVNVPAHAGTAVHKALEIYYTGGTSDDALRALWLNYYEFATNNTLEGDRLSYNNVAGIVSSWMQLNPIANLPYRVLPDCVEVPFSLSLNEEGNIIYTGYIDAAAERTDGQGLYLIDTKSTGRIDAKFSNQFYLSTQLSGYVWALEQLLERLVTGIYINVVDMKKMPDSKRKCPTHKAPYVECGFLHMHHGLDGPYYRHAESIHTWRKNALRLAKQWKRLLDNNIDDITNIINVPQSGMFRYQSCVLCGFHNFCRKGRVVDLIDFTEEPWYPGSTLEIIKDK